MTIGRGRLEMIWDSNTGIFSFYVGEPSNVVGSVEPEPAFKEAVNWYLAGSNGENAGWLFANLKLINVQRTFWNCVLSYGPQFWDRYKRAYLKLCEAKEEKPKMEVVFTVIEQLRDQLRIAKEALNT